MGQIKNNKTYPPDALITDLDRVIGSDIDNLDKTKNYLMKDIKDYCIANIPGFDQNNLIPEISISLDNSITPISYDSLIQNYLNTITLVVTDKQLPLYRFHIINNSLDPSQNVTIIYFWGLGKGTFIHPLLTDFRKITITIPSAQDISSQPNTVTLELGIISNQTTFVDIINYSPTPINFNDPLFIYLVTFTQNNETFFYKFIGNNDIYGVGLAQCTINDFISLTFDVELGYYILKSTEDYVNISGTGIVDSLTLSTERASFRFNGTITDLKSISYINPTLHHNGKCFSFTNLQATPVNIWHNAGGGSTKFNFSSEVNFILGAKQTIEFKLDLSNPALPILYYIGIIGTVIIDAIPTDGSTNSVSSNGVFDALALKAPLVSPALTGTPTAPTAAPATNTTQIATTAFVLANTGAVTEAQIATINHAATAKTILVDADEVTGQDSANSFSLIRTVWSDVWTYIKSKADTFYQATLVSGTNIKTLDSDSILGSGNLLPKTELAYACSDETSNLTVGNLISFRMPFAFTLSEVRISVNDAPTVSSLIVDVKEGGVSIFSTLLSIDSSELTSVTAAVPAVISDVNLADDALITVSTTQIGSGNTGKGLKILFKGRKA